MSCYLFNGIDSDIGVFNVWEFRNLVLKLKLSGQFDSDIVTNMVTDWFVCLNGKDTCVLINGNEFIQSRVVFKDGIKYLRVDTSVSDLVTFHNEENNGFFGNMVRSTPVKAFSNGCFISNPVSDITVTCGIDYKVPIKYKGVDYSVTQPPQYIRELNEGLSVFGYVYVSLYNGEDYKGTKMYFKLSRGSFISLDFGDTGLV